MPFCLNSDKFSVRSVNVVIVRVTSRLVLSLCNHARDTIQKHIFQCVFRLVQTRLLLAQRRGFEPPDESPPSHDFQSCSLNHSDISARNESYFTTISPKMQLLFIRFLHFSVSEMKKYFCPCISPSQSINQQHLFHQPARCNHLDKYYA